MTTIVRRTLFAPLVAAVLVGLSAACSDDTSLPMARDASPPTRPETLADPERVLDFLPDNDRVGDSDGTVLRNRW